MRIETTQQIVPLVDEATDENGEMTFIPNGETVIVETTDIYADEGKAFTRLSDGAVLSNHITVGTMDSVENYVEVVATIRKTIN